MKIQFCDLCSESVPDADFALGRAFRRQGRVICSACDSSMTTSKRLDGVGSSSAADEAATRLSAGVGPGSPRSAVVPAPPAANPQTAAVSGPAAPRSLSAPGWTSVAALLLALVGGYYLHSEVEVLRAADASLQGGLTSEVNRLGSDLDTFSLNSQRRAQELEDRMGATITRNHETWKGSNGTLQAELERVTKLVGTFDSNLARIEELQRADTVDNGRRLDDFLAQSMKLRVEVRDLQDRLARAENSIGSERPLAGSSPGALPEKKPLPYASHLVDLKSDVAGTRWNAIYALGETGDPEVVPHLIPYLKDPDTFVRMAVARTFGDLNSPLAIESLIDALEDKESIVREASMQALHAITGRDFRFDPQAKEADRKKRVAAWRSWWEKSSQDFVGDL